ncbi:Snf7-domain-containing protein [Gonapodya prolifera JEL478]|uniref:Snf7-domain-containing protein n=1 Tax=Gonapodya prolifera (strain JEL478) TaxID=1344416 RepID=A0A139AXA9_GONPJ|nr:Snf7-domain-containing protein [Gonapodya prolifera JEL478]|eukprot:KXS21339.1 Snf7-domain-containing protein [Gonapodya prolifera JEL478]
MSGILETLFGRQKTPAELLRQHQRSLQRAMRELDRERAKMEASEKKIIQDIKKAAKDNQMNACKTMAKDLVRTRRYVQKFYQMRTQLQGVSLRIQTLRSNQSMSEAMRGVTKAMRMMNNQIKLPQVAQIMQEFEKESQMMDVKEEMMNEAIDGAMEDDEDEDEEERVVQEVFDEIGISLDAQLASAPTSKVGVAAAAKVKNTPQAVGAFGDGGGADDIDAALQARLDNLRRD